MKANKNQKLGCERKVQTEKNMDDLKAAKLLESKELEYDRGAKGKVRHSYDCYIPFCMTSVPKR